MGLLQAFEPNLRLFQESFEAIFQYTLGPVHKSRHPIRGYGGVSQKMTKDDREEGGGLAKDDR